MINTNTINFNSKTKKMTIQRTNVSLTNKPDTNYVIITDGQKAVINILLKRGWTLEVNFIQYLTKEDKKKNRPHFSITKTVKSLVKLGLRVETKASKRYYRNKLIESEVEVKNISKPVLKYGSFCTGMGSSATALKELGVDFDFVYSSEIEKHQKATVNHNFDVENNFGDLFKLSGKELPYVDMISAGFPCQTFSLAGKQAGFDDRRGTVVFHLSKIFHELIENNKAPKIIKLENVSHIARHDSEKGEYDSIFADKDHKKKIGHTLHVIETEVFQALSKYYDITWSIDNTLFYGIPHNRSRWFCTLTLKNSPYTFDFSNVRAKRVPLTTCVNDYLIPEYKVDKTCYVDNEFIPESYRNRGHLQRVGSLEGVSYQQSRRVLGVEKSASCFTCGENSKYLIRGKVRTLDIPEKLTLQAFPKWYKFPKSVSKSSKHKMLGNTMSVNITKVIYGVMFDKNNFKNPSLTIPTTSANEIQYNNTLRVA